MSHKKWRMRERGSPLPRLWGRLELAAADNIDYHGDPILGFPGTPPLSNAVAAHEFFSASHPNNIGYHTGPNDAELGFVGTQRLERELIYTVADLAGASDPESQIDGYICNGGTEGNDHALWLGRNRLLASEAEGGIAVLASFLTHYSVAKHFGRLFESDGRGRHILREMPTNPHGEIDADVIREEVAALYGRGFRRFLVILNAGTTNLGSVDRIQEACAALEEMQQSLGIAVHVHVDAAFGGFILPFLDPSVQFGFQNPLVQSVVMDGHKMGFAPYSAGIFLCRKGLLRYTTTAANYLAAHSDSTVPGSRSGAISAAVWTCLHSLGRAGYRKIIERCLRNADYLRRSLESLNAPGRERVRFCPSGLNVLAVQLDEKLHSAMTQRHGRRSLQEKFCIPQDHFPSDFRNPSRGPDGGIVRDVVVNRFVVMPHLNRRKINQFLRELRSAAGIG